MSYEAIPNGVLWQVRNTQTGRIVVSRVKDRESAVKIKHALEANREKRQMAIAGGA
jgi:hypothetical protein